MSPTMAYMRLHHAICCAVIDAPRGQHSRNSILEATTILSSCSAWPRTEPRCPSSAAQTLAPTPAD
eukprot:6340580-Alexandrium_andersonii.AAC.1